jgi:superfamily II RNA helicase
MTHSHTMTSLLITPDAMIAPSIWPPISASGEVEALAIQTKYELDPFQKHAVLGIHAGDHVFVTAKTGSGKTFVGEYLIAYWLARGKRVFYTTPIKSLSNQKYHDLKKLFPHATVGILTGDIKMCPDAQIVVMTAEILRNLFYKRGTATEGVGLTAAVSLTDVAGVVMDEVHYIQDPDRGHVWEETLILCPHDFQLVLLSATLPSAASLAGWLADLHQRRTWLLSTTYRIVPLVHGLLTSSDSGWKVMPVLDTQSRWIGEAYTGWLRGRKAVADSAVAYKKQVEARRRDGYAGPVPGGKVKVEDPISRLLRTVAWLDETKQMPALFFVFSRKECERYAGLMVGSLIDSSDAAAAGHIIDFHLSRHRAALEKSPQYHKIRDLLIRGIAFHHSGLQPLLKEIVEILFTRGYVKVLFATETFSVGLNMPTKTVVFLELEKWCHGTAKRMLRPDEYIQMAGRAGRRGLDTQGLVLYEPMRDPVDAGELKGLLTGALPALQSRMRFHYDFILKHKLTGGKLPIAEQSYWAVEQRRTRVSLTKEIEMLQQQLDTLVERMPAAEEALLATRDALQQEVAANVNAKRKKAQQALTKWMDEHDSKTLAQRIGRYEELKTVRKELGKLTDSAAAWDAAPLLALEPLEECLQTWGFLDADGLTPVGLSATDASAPRNATVALTPLGVTATEAACSTNKATLTLTPLGVSATEINEGHMILMPLLAASGRMADLTGEEMVATLAVFLREGADRDDAPTLDSVGNTKVSEVLHWLEGTTQSCVATEASKHVFSPNNFWTLSATWVLIVEHWLAGAGLTEIANEFGLFEGNVQRALMRIANILEEWGAIATLRRDLVTLEKLAALNFLRNEIVVDSLYLRL